MASFYVYDLIFLLAFSLFVFIFLYRRKKKLTKEGIMYLYKTGAGIKFINYVGEHNKKLLNALKYVIIAVSYATMIGMVYLLVKSIEFFFSNPTIVKEVVKIPPLAPVIPYLPEIFKAQFLPPFYFTYFIIALAIVAIVHEFSHGIFMRLFNIRIKSTGFAFLGPMLGAFVEADENKMKKIKKSNQIAILGAGSFSNWAFTLIFFLVMWLFFSLAFSPAGSIFNIYAYTAINTSSINSLGNNLSINFDGGLNVTEVFVGNKTYYAPQDTNFSRERVIVFDSPALRAGLNGVIVQVNEKKVRNNNDLKNILESYKPGDKVTVKTLQITDNYLNIKTSDNLKDYEVTLGENPVTGKAYLGIASLQQQSSLLGKVRGAITSFKDPNTFYAPRFNPELMIFIYNLFLWIVLINFSVALGNMLPVGFVDGGRIFYLTMLAIFRNEKVAKRIFGVMTYLVLASFALLMALWAWAFF